LFTLYYLIVSGSIYEDEAKTYQIVRVAVTDAKFLAAAEDDIVSIKLIFV